MKNVSDSNTLEKLKHSLIPVWSISNFIRNTWTYIKLQIKIISSIVATKYFYLERIYISQTPFCIIFSERKAIYILDVGIHTCMIYTLNEKMQINVLYTFFKKENSSKEIRTFIIFVPPHFPIILWNYNKIKTNRKFFPCICICFNIFFHTF